MIDNSSNSTGNRALFIWTTLRHFQNRLHLQVKRVHQWNCTPTVGYHIEFSRNSDENLIFFYEASLPESEAMTGLLTWTWISTDLTIFETPNYVLEVHRSCVISALIIFIGFTLLFKIRWRDIRLSFYYHYYSVLNQFCDNLCFQCF